jgi:preprotein translocase subunit SecA
MEDDLMLRFLPGIVRRAVGAQIRGKLPAAQWLARAAVARAQHSAQRLAFERRRSVLRMDTWLEDSLSFAYRDVS